MSDAMEVLYAYAQDHLLQSLLDRQPDYAEALRHADGQEKALRALLGGDAARLDALLDEWNDLSFYREQALFRAGFQIAMELAARV